MPLEHDAPRFTLDQRDEILNLAARLQIQHESTVGVDELIAEAVASGIDPRFVQEATIRLERKPRPQRMRAPFVAFVLFTLHAVGLMLAQYRWAQRGSTGLEWPDFVAAAGVAVLLALWASRTVAVRRFVPLVPVAVWASIALSAGGVQIIFDTIYFRDWIVPTASLYALVQSAAVVLALTFVRAAEWRPSDAHSFRLDRGGRA